VDSRRFLLATLGVTAALCAAFAAVNARVNFYGVFGDVRGASREVVSNERWTKYMYAFNYIPANFDGMLIGSSVSDNLDTSQIRGYRVYNACLGGGDSTEEELIVDSALDHGAHLRVLLVSLDRPLLDDRGRKAGGMEPRDYWSALGSLQLLRDYAALAGIRARVLPERWSAFGVQDYELSGMPRVDADAVAKDVLARDPHARIIQTDALAVGELDALFKRVRGRGARLVGFFPPVYQPVYAASSYGEFERTAHALFAPGERIIDFNDGAFPAITTNALNFRDGIHLSRAGAALVTATLAETVNRF
jgi:hypothetical protein